MIIATWLRPGWSDTLEQVGPVYRLTVQTEHGGHRVYELPVEERDDAVEPDEIRDACKDRGYTVER